MSYLNIELEDDNLKIKKQIESLELTNKTLTENLDKCYLDKLKGILDEDGYLRISDNIKKEIKQNTDERNNLKENTNFNQIDKEQIKKYINDFLNIENPSRDLIINLVDKIYIYQDKTIDIIYTFKNR